jgi:hypothetical protein
MPNVIVFFFGERVMNMIIEGKSHMLSPEGEMS